MESIDYVIKIRVSIHLHVYLDKIAHTGIGVRDYIGIILIRCCIVGCFD